ncbi:MAG: C10 family peptidase [Prevotella sp.]|nr:C10 family peptidase [Prevotella sp.]
MKRNILNITIILLLLFITKVNANPIDVNDAKSKAEQVLAFQNTREGKVRRSPMNINVKHLETSHSSEDEYPLYYIFNRENSPGFAVIAGDDSMPSVIGYSLEKSFDINNMPEALKFMLDQYETYIKENQNKKVSKRIGPLEPGAPVIGPLLKTEWSQEEPYNWLTPAGTPTGCTPTAAAQVLNYHQWPAMSTYRQYDWKNMLDTYSTYSYTEGMAVATLMRDLGVIMGSSYSSSGTSTHADAYERIPGYHCTQTNDLQGSLTKGPLVICTDGGLTHSVVVDGYEENGYYHVNWGWGGSCDGYYNLEDMGIIYNEKETHSHILPSYTYLLEPDKDTPPVVLAAREGVTVNRETAQKGDEVTVTLHNLSLMSGNQFDGYIGLSVFYYRNAGGYFSGLYTRYIDNRVSWNSGMNGKDLDVTITIDEDLREGKTYYIVPEFVNAQDKNTWIGTQLLQFADESIQEVIPFTYKNGVIYFEKKKYGDYKLELSQLTTASTYIVDGRSCVFSLATNKGSNDFHGTLTAWLTNENNANEEKTIDIDITIPADTILWSPMNTTFDFMGTYRIKQIEIWKNLPSGERVSYLKQSIDTPPFAIKNLDAGEKTIDFLRADVGVQNFYHEKRGHYVNNSIYQHELLTMYYNLFSLTADTANVDLELWCVPVGGGKPIMLMSEKRPWSSNYLYREDGIYSRTDKLMVGDYRLLLFGRCGRNTFIFQQEESPSYVDEKVTDHILHIIKTDKDIPQLSLKNIYLPEKLHSSSNTTSFGNSIELELENIGHTDFFNPQLSLEVLSDHIGGYGDNPFRIRKGQMGTISLDIRSFDLIKGKRDGYLAGIFDDEDHRVIIPIGKFCANFEENSKEYQFSANYPRFYYKNQMNDIYCFLNTNTTGTFKRSLWQKGKEVFQLNNITLADEDSYFIVTGDELQNIPTGFYILRLDKTDCEDHEFPSLSYSIIIDEMDAISIESIEVDKEHELTLDDDIPVTVVINNNHSQPVTTMMETYVLNKQWNVDNRYSQYVNLEPKQKTIIKTSMRIMDEANKKDGTFSIQSEIYNTIRENGMLDRRYRSTSITLPFTASSILEQMQNISTAPKAYYSLGGKRLVSPQKGVNIIRMSDGTTRKVVIQ